jgi:23S rRNA pseudouridine2605 synthase
MVQRATHDATTGHHPRGRTGTTTSVKIVSSAAEQTLLKITLQEGRNRIVRRTMEAVGHPVRSLSRIGIGPVRLGNLKVGEFRELTREELGGLLDLTGG